MDFASTTHKGLVRKENQDLLGNLKLQNGYLFVVCDGVGGLPKGALASRIAVDTILTHFSGISENIEHLLKQSIFYAHENIVKASKNRIGTTVTAVYLENGNSYAAWCGDSRIYHFRDHGIEWMSRDHNVLHDVLNKGQGRGDMFQNPHAITRFLGNTSNHEIDLYKFHSDPGDHILICSDGLSGFIMEQDIVHAVTQNSPQEASDLLEKKLLAKEIGAPDNFTWYIIQL